MATVRRTNLGPILRAVKAWLVAQRVLPASQIKLCARNNPPRQQAEQELLLRPRGFTVDKEWADPGGRAATAIRRKVSVYCRVRSTTDEADRDEDWLLHESRGYFALEEKVADALQIFAPELAYIDSGNVLQVDWLLIEPIHLVSADDPTKDKVEPEWGEASLAFEVFYMLALDQSRE